MTPFIHENFLLNNSTAQHLYHDVAMGLPIIDYHCHINPKLVAENAAFSDIAELWIASDPYKHRAMRMHGIPERLCSGDAGHDERFLAWAETVPHTVGNPLFHWNALELERYFQIDQQLDVSSAHEIRNVCNGHLGSPEFLPQELLRRSNVECLVTSDDLLDDLKHHQRLATDGATVKVIPSLRADSVILRGSGGDQAYFEKLGALTGVAVTDRNTLAKAVISRLDVFTAAGCRVSDHGLHPFRFVETSAEEIDRIVQKMVDGKSISPEERTKYQSWIMVFLGEQYHSRGWMMMMHFGAQRRTSTRLKDLAGAAGGYACIGTGTEINDIANFLDTLEQRSMLPRTALFNLNPVDNAAFASMCGSFAEDGIAGKIQFGPAWWFNDHKPGMENQLIALATHGLLSHFIGMTTDSRSLLSYSRHEYFRRIFCNLLGTWVEVGELPNDDNLLSGLIQRVCYQNAYNTLFPEDKQ